MFRRFILLCCCLSMMGGIPYAYADKHGVKGLYLASTPLTLSQCIELALEQNRKRHISRFAVETAEYQHKQALSSFWPQITAETALSQQDEDVNFIFPSNTISYNINIPGFGTFPGQTEVPEQNVTVMDRKSITSSLNMTYPIFTGGLRSNAVKAAKSNIQAAKQALRRTELELVRDVQRMYYGAVLARRLSDIGEETLVRLHTTTDLTERLFKGGSGSVTKLDYLRSKVVLESARSIVERLISNVELAHAALGNTMGLRWDESVILAEKEIPFVEVDTDLGKMVAGAYRFNPDWNRLAAGLEAGKALVNKERSAHWPKVALNGTLWRWDNGLDNSGMATKENENGWSIGIGLRMPIFSGFMTSNKINEAKARLRTLESQQILLKEGLALQVKHGIIRVNRSQKIRNATVKAAGHAREHRDLAVRAYMNELVSTELVIESQIIEALTRAKAEMAQYENAASRFDIDFVIGQEMKKLLDSNS